MDQRPLGKAIQIVVRADEGICKAFPAVEGVEALYIIARHQPVAKLNRPAQVSHTLYLGSGVLGGLAKSPETRWMSAR